MTATWTLHRTGRRAAGAWKYLVTSLPEVTAAWADLTGFHVTDGLPDTPPLATHLWAWRTGTWLRLRLDHPHWWGALLTNTDVQPASPWIITRESVPTVEQHPLLHWNPGADQISQRQISPREALTSLKMVELVPLRQTTASFVGTADTLR
jgi:hypothetical protein